VSSQALYFKLNAGRKRIQCAVYWILLGAFFIFIAFNAMLLSWAQVLLFATGAWWICAGTVNLLPMWHIRRGYQKSDVAGQKYRADVNEEGFEVVGDLCTWRIRWAGMSIKGEDERVFMLYSVGVIFMFGKKYLTDEQQHEFRRLAGLAAQ
jgi:hypothetical protein